MDAAEDAGQTILVVDDVPANLKLLDEILSAHGYEVRAASNGRLALRTVAVRSPNLILLDINMPDMDGYEVCRQLKAQETSRSIPIIFISANNDVADKLRGFAVGGVDYVTKPFEVAEVMARVRTHLRLQAVEARLIAQNRQLAEEIAERRRAEAELQFLATHDSLTGLLNRPMLLDRLGQAIADANRSGQRFWVCFMDLDRFKWINDTLGHDAGDILLVTAARRMQACLRDTDTIVRLGGDEFVLLLRNVEDIEQALSTLRRVANSLAEPIQLKGQEVSVSCSVGCCAYPGDGGVAEDLLRRADSEMYRVKRAGGNRISLYGNEIDHDIKLGVCA